MLLLAFDEFEKLEEAQLHGYFNVDLLLNWFRSIIQNWSSLALLFSGIHTVSEMQGNWVGYFVNAQTHKVSFLKPEEARKLIMAPAPDFSGEEIFGEDVAGEILRVTGCHPFLIQAVCEKLIDQLNDDNRSEASIQDVIQAVDKILETWDNYFQDLWGRTDEEQRACLLVLNNMGECDKRTIMQHSEIDKKTVRRTLQTLLKRDLVGVERTAEHETYRITTPIFSEWVKRNSIV